jgi:hypothetical protein
MKDETIAKELKAGWQKKYTNSWNRISYLRFANNSISFK